jgi:hypothetical protein
MICIIIKQWPTKNHLYFAKFCCSLTEIMVFTHNYSILNFSWISYTIYLYIVSGALPGWCLHYLPWYMFSTLLVLLYILLTFTSHQWSKQQRYRYDTVYLSSSCKIITLRIQTVIWKKKVNMTIFCTAHIFRSSLIWPTQTYAKQSTLAKFAGNHANGAKWPYLETITIYCTTQNTWTWQRKCMGTMPNPM